MAHSNIEECLFEKMHVCLKPSPSSPSPETHRYARSTNNSHLSPSQHSSFDHVLKELLHRLTIIRSGKWLVWYRTVQDLAKWFPSILDIEEKQFLRWDNSPDVVFVYFKKFCIVSKVSNLKSDDLRGPSRFFLLV